MLKRIVIATVMTAMLVFAVVLEYSEAPAQSTSVAQPGRPRIAKIAASTSQVKLDSIDITNRTPDRVHAACAVLVVQNQTSKREFAFPSEMRYWTTWDVPEYQDSQRFVDSPSAEASYGPQACIVAAPNLATLTQADFDDPNGVLVAGIVVNFDAQPVNGSYKRLNIAEASSPFHCVIIRHTTPSPWPFGVFSKRLDRIAVPNFAQTPASTNDDGWESYVVPSIGGACAIRKGDSPVPGMRFTIQELGAAHIAPVARWTLDRSWRAGIGVRCGEAWCNIGFAKSDLEPPAHGFGESGVASQVGRRVIPGWFDDQRLAVPGGAGLGIRPGLHASIVPDTALDSYRLEDFKNKWLPVATVHFADDPAKTKYQTNWHFLPGGEVGNLIELMLETGTTDKWRVRINGREWSNLKVMRTPHAFEGFHVWGTARWAWSDKDELIWVSCAEGCCLVDAM